MKRGTKLLYKKIFAGLLGGGMLFMPNWSYALPSGGQVVTNNGTITAGGKVMDITGSGNVAIDWNSFNIAADEIVNFKNMQAVLNYVSGGSKSEIFGKLNGAGVNVFLVNPNGILFGKTAQVNVGQLTASTRSLEKAALNSFNGSLSPLDAGGAANVKADIINLGKLKAGKLVLEGNNLSIIGSDSLEVADKSKITLRAGENINIGYEVTDKTTIDVGDGKGNTHQVSDYGKGGGDKASDVLSTASVTDLKGSAKSINDAMLVHDVYELQAIDRNTGTINGSSYVVGNYMLTGDIDAGDTKNWNSGRGFDPIGRLNRTGNGVTGSFSGAFDGICHSIQNLYIRQIGNQYDGYIGLFEGIGKGGSVISNSYYKTDTGYKKYGDDSEYESIEAFNAAFLAGMTDSDKALWLTYGDRMPPLLKGLLKPLDINVGDIETEYTGGDYTGLAQALADKLAEQGIIIDVTKLLADGKTEIGEYDLKDLLFSTQDGYALNVTGKLVIKEKSPEPEPPADNYAPSSDSKYTGTLTNIKAEKMQQEEYRNLDKRRRNTIEQASVSVEGDGIKLE